MKDSTGILLLFLLLAAVVAYTLLNTKIKGWVGEKTVAAILSMLDGSRYKVINNVVLSSNGKTVQIDHLVISHCGVFVIETKNYKGWILGGENSEYWTQVIYQWKSKFYNPIRQNAGHIKALKSKLQEFTNLPFISIIVFSNRATIKARTNTPVIQPLQLLRFIGNYSPKSISDTEMEEIFIKIKSINLKGNYNKAKHITAIGQRVKIREESLRQRKCPKCGSDLRIRQGKFGKFFGCSAFPMCKFTSNA